ncbi:ISL3 family transposase [Desemzia sp. C1]|uniref:ISL3 family transposase n=1 Tax=Desemzia sp. C1 TaxID=2892016 RepID=UPI001E604247|nr:ISL3 family transposase [Desemzia sp. C1]MCI3027756.1 ISL3 family transposase [Desemzia sp. C1]
MSYSHSIRTSLNLKDLNIQFEKDFCKDTIIKGKTAKAYYAKLTYTPDRCPNCGMKKNGYSIIKHGYKESRITLNSTTHYPTYLFLKKQRFFCKACTSTFSAETKEVARHCFISTQTKQSIAIEAADKISEKDLAKRHHVSVSTTSRMLTLLGEQYKLNPEWLPEHLCFDEFKSVSKALSFIYMDSKTHQVIDVLPDRKLATLRMHFGRYTYSARLNVKTIVIDMNTPYFTLINELFPKAKIIIDPFHLVQLISRSMNQTRVALMNSYRTSDSEEMKHYRKLKNYWPLVLKKEENLEAFNYTYQRLFKGLKTQRGIIDYLLTLGDTFQVTYEFYQRLLYAFDQQDYSLFMDCLNTAPKGLSSYMKTSLRTLKKYQHQVKNTFSYPFTNGPLEGTNNKIKVLKRIAFGFRRFTKFKTRILLSCNTIQN